MIVCYVKYGFRFLSDSTNIGGIFYGKDILVKHFTLLSRLHVFNSDVFFLILSLLKLPSMPEQFLPNSVYFTNFFSLLINKFAKLAPLSKFIFIILFHQKISKSFVSFATVFSFSNDAKHAQIQKASIVKLTLNFNSILVHLVI